MRNPLLLLAILILVFAVFPRAGGYSANWGYWPSGGLGVVLVVLVVLVLLRVI